MSRLATPVSSRDHRTGPDHAPVTLVEYGDYECPHCGMAYPIVEQVRRTMGDALRFVYRHFPLREVHPHAEHAAEAAESAGQQHAFWPMHDELFLHQDALRDRDLIAYASAIAIDAERVANDLAAGTWEPRVQEEFIDGVRSGVNGTPTFFINGVRHDEPWDFETLMRAVQRAAGAAVVS